MSLYRKELENLVWHIKAISNLQKLETPFNACYSLALVCKGIGERIGAFFIPVLVYFLSQDEYFNIF